VSTHTLLRLRRALTPGGTLVPNGGQYWNRWIASSAVLIKAPLLSLVVSQRIRPFLQVLKQNDLLALKELLEAGKVTPVIDRTYPLSQAREAIGYFGEGHAHGKVVITV